MKEKRKRFAAKLNEHEKELYKTLSKEERNNLVSMREDQAKQYLYSKSKQGNTIQEMKDEFLRIVGDLDKSDLSKRASKEVLESKEYKCKYCGQGFNTEEAVDKHQRTCV